MLMRSQKEKVVKDLQDKIGKAQAVFLTNLIGLSANDAGNLRKEVRDVDGGIVITRNTLFRIAAKGTPCEKMLSNLKGSNAVAFAFKEAPAVAKVLYEAGKKFKDLVDLRVGMLDGKELSAAQLVELAQLPGKDQMLASLLATFNAPVSSFARVLDLIRQNKEKGTVSSEA